MMCFDPIIEEACEQLFWIRHDLSSAQDALLEASHDSFTSVVSVETAERIRTVLGTIRNGLAMLSNLAGSLGARKSVFPLVPAVDIGDPDSSLVVGRDLPAPNAASFLLDACDTMHHFQDHVDILSSQFSTLQSAEADNDFSKAPGVVAVGEGDSADDDEQEDDGSAGDDDEQEQSHQAELVIPASASLALASVSNLAATAAVDSSLPPSTTATSLIALLVRDCRLVVSNDNYSYHIDGPVHPAKLFMHLVGEEQESIFVSVGTSCTVILFLGVTIISSLRYREFTGKNFDLEEDCRITAVGFFISKSLSKTELECLRRYERMQPLSTYCIVGLPYFESSWFSSSDSTLEIVLCYSTSTVENSRHKVLNIRFFAAADTRSLD